MKFSSLLAVTALFELLSVSIATAQSTDGEFKKAPPCSIAWSKWQSCDGYAWRAFDDNRYYVRNNTWGQSNPGAGRQCMWARSQSCWGVKAEHANGTGIPKGYPQAVRGWVTGDGFKTENSGMGISVNDLTKAHVHWSTSAPDHGRYMALWDIYFHDRPNPAGSDLPHTSLMINQRIADDGYYAGIVANLPEVELDGQTFRLRKYKADWASGNVIELFKTPVTGQLFGSEDMSLDLKTVIFKLRDMGLIPASDYLTSIQIGWEIIDGGVFQTKSFWTALQNEPDPE